MLLLQNPNTDVDIANSGGMTPLHMACGLWPGEHSCYTPDIGEEQVVPQLEDQLRLYSSHGGRLLWEGGCGAGDAGGGGGGPQNQEH